ncbi:leucine dehydrogenase-like isoform X2 [Ruditapes philippinarum]|uniref:leucine dehydrogenase-like isoform X2 n=1 Tax=Ruditapes philippinarum TaxID=129788 RepID=UPI00295A6415|nr:leucine dehydrogenase-like isoform X2 [Ruditapes philippinarum]
MRFVLKSIKPLCRNHSRQLSFISVVEKPLQFTCQHELISKPFTKSESLQFKCLKDNFRYRMNTDFNQVRCCSSDTSSNDLHKMLPAEFQEKLKDKKISRCYIISEEGNVKYSHDELKELIPESELKSLDFEHEAIFFYSGTRSDCLMSVFLWRTDRGQGVGGVDYRAISSMAELILDGNKFSKGLGIKSALAGMWAGGGKGFVLAPVSRQFDPEFRRKVFLDFGDFLTSLNGCMVAGVGIGSSVPDIDTMFTQSRYVSNVTPFYGGSVNSSVYTGLGVVKAMEAAIEFLEMGSLEGKTVAIQGAGNVGQVIIDELLRKNVKHIYVTECNSMTISDVKDMFASKADGRLTISKVSFEDTSIFRTKCDIFSPCARGKVLNDTTIPMLDTKIICGASNLPVHTDEDHIAIMERKITYVTDVVPNRMGIVSKLLEPYGRMGEDPDLDRHLSTEWQHSIYQTTLRILNMAAKLKIHPEKAAYILGEELSREIHPLYPHRTQRIIQGLVKSGWHEGKDFWNTRWGFNGDQLV